MGIIQKILNSVDLEIANEAEDITKNLDTGVNDIFNNTEYQLDDNQVDNNEDKKESTNETDDSSTDTTDNEMNNNDESTKENDDNQDDLESDEEPVEQDNEQGASDEVSNKRILHEKMMYFFDILNSNIDILSSYNPESSDLSIIESLNNIKSNLIECREITHRVLTNNFDDTNYVELTRKYVSLKRVYDLCIEMLDKLFENIGEDNAPKLKKHSKK